MTRLKCTAPPLLFAALAIFSCAATQAREPETGNASDCLQSVVEIRDYLTRLLDTELMSKADRNALKDVPNTMAIFIATLRHGKGSIDDEEYKRLQTTCALLARQHGALTNEQLLLGAKLMTPEMAAEVRRKDSRSYEQIVKLYRVLGSEMGRTVMSALVKGRTKPQEEQDVEAEPGSESPDA
ncbi:MAG: hypothetical protein OXI90_07945 [Gammaproteobacteria bacterium]|nr:hypothetical protein [Gammaproteobacteria bacterium]